MPQLASEPRDIATLLRGVSRSFYVSIRLLPAALRRPVAVAYLLARATDTVADAPGLAAEARREMLELLATAIEGRTPVHAGMARLAASLTALHESPQERELILALPDCLDRLDALEPPDRDDVRAVLRHITYGQSLDIERFAQGTGPQALQTAAQLDEYTYLVAGCVGEFWTDLCVRHVPGFAMLPPAQMRELGRDYGKALQLVNILRDAGADLAAGRCYFPAEELAAAGLRAQDLLAQPRGFADVRHRWVAQAQHGLDAGMRYALAVNSRRVRAATALPALLGARTLALLRADSALGLRHKVKVPRDEVRATLVRLALTLAARRPLRSQFEAASAAR